jgi:hypothetical protein
MRHIGLFGIAAAVTACGGATDPLASGGGSGDVPSFSGAVAGSPVPATDQLAARGTTLQGSTAVAYAAVLFTNVNGICGFLQRHENPANATALSIEVEQVVPSRSTATDVSPGTYSIYPAAPRISVGAFAMVHYVALDARCSTTISEAGASGTVNITESDGSVVAGSVDVTFDNGDHVTGSFSAPVCNGDPFVSTAGCGS